jgi:hypothetical protein
VSKFLQSLRFKQLLLLLAACCAFALPGAMMIKQARAGELLQMLCTAEGKKAIAGTTASHDCMQCCTGSATVPPLAPSAQEPLSISFASPTARLPSAILNAAYLTPAATGPPFAR